MIHQEPLPSAIIRVEFSEVDVGEGVGFDPSRNCSVLPPPPSISTVLGKLPQDKFDGILPKIAPYLAK